MAHSDHRRLFAWQLARRLAHDARALTRGLPAGHESLVRQTDRAAAASLRRIAAGAAAEVPAARAEAFAQARGEMAELEASLDAIELVGLADTQELCDQADRVGVLLGALADAAGEAQPHLRH
ncbi:MAG: four helix bundle protein [Planctomycetota bacterium]|nr:four helix bundle protein [Planctomycetota bacterium]